MAYSKGNPSVARKGSRLSRGKMVEAIIFYGFVFTPDPRRNAAQLLGIMGQIPLCKAASTLLYAPTAYA
jgi:hypothetical protein